MTFFYNLYSTYGKYVWCLILSTRLINSKRFASSFEAFYDDLKNYENVKTNSKDEWLIPGPILHGKCSVLADQG